MSDTDTIKGLTQEQVDKLTADGLLMKQLRASLRV